VTTPGPAEPAHPLTLNWSGMTHVGRFRTNNEDAFLALTFDAREIRYLGKTGSATMDAADFVFAVSDGMGGAKSGEFASKIAVEKITRLLPPSFGMAARHLEAGFSDVLRELFERIHGAISDLGRYYPECQGMGATLSLCWFMPGWMCFSHIGDSRIYYLPKDGAMIQVTHDHSHVGWLRRAGKINEREARTHPGRSSLSQALGGGNQRIDPHIGRVGCQPGDRFLICSDGLVDGLWDKRLNELARRELDAGALVLEAVADSGRDNTTALLIEVS
jgi:serine/threonine protein phosphatase PrpC